jgi:hypothetical protein
MKPEGQTSQATRSQEPVSSEDADAGLNAPLPREWRLAGEHCLGCNSDAQVRGSDGVSSAGRREALSGAGEGQTRQGEAYVEGLRRARGIHMTQQSVLGACQRRPITLQAVIRQLADRGLKVSRRSEEKGYALVRPNAAGVGAAASPDLPSSVGIGPSTSFIDPSRESLALSPRALGQTSAWVGADNPDRPKPPAIIEWNWGSATTYPGSTPGLGSPEASRGGGSRLPAEGDGPRQCPG